MAKVISCEPLSIIWDFLKILFSIIQSLVEAAPKSSIITVPAAWSNVARIEENISISKKRDSRLAFFEIFWYLEMASLCITASNTSILGMRGVTGSAALGKGPPIWVCSSLGITHQSKATSVIGTGTYLRASMGTILDNSLSLISGISMTETRLETIGIAIPHFLVVVLDSRNTSLRATTIFSYVRLVARPTSRPAYGPKEISP